MTPMKPYRTFHCTIEAEIRYNQTTCLEGNGSSFHLMVTNLWRNLKKVKEAEKLTFLQWKLLRYHMEYFYIGGENKSSVSRVADNDFMSGVGKDMIPGIRQLIYDELSFLEDRERRGE